MKLRTFSRQGTHKNPAVMELGDPFDDGQTDPAAVVFLSCGGDPVETVENPLLMFGGDAAAEIAYTEIHRSTVVGTGGENFDPSRSAV